MENIIKGIEQADEVLLNEYIGAIMHRYNALRPDREGIFITISTDPCVRKEELEKVIRFLQTYYDKRASR